MELIHRYFPDLTDKQKSQFQQLLPLYSEWNAKINVISRKDMDQFYCNHVLHSLSITTIHTFKPDEWILDIGTGGGFPGIPLAILFPLANFHLVDSIRKKTKVVEAVSQSLELKNVTVTNARFEDISQKHDSIISRAVAPALKLVQLTKNAMNSKGQHLFIKGGDLSAEKEDILHQYPSRIWDEYPLKDHFNEAFFETKKIVRLSQK